MLRNHSQVPGWRDIIFFVFVSAYVRVILIFLIFRAWAFRSRSLLCVFHQYICVYAILNVRLNMRYRVSYVSKLWPCMVDGNLHGYSSISKPYILQQFGIQSLIHAASLKSVEFRLLTYNLEWTLENYF